MPTNRLGFLFKSLDLDMNANVPKISGCLHFQYIEWRRSMVHTVCPNMSKQYSLFEMRKMRLIKNL